MFGVVLAVLECGILGRRPEVEPTAPALEADVLTTGLPGKSLPLVLNTHVSVKSVACLCVLLLSSSGC